MTGKPKDIGNCCRAAIARAKADGAKDTAAWHRAAECVHEEAGGQTAGNGALMRTVYPGLYYKASEAHFAASVIARMTHGHDLSTMATILYTRAISDIVSDEDGDVGRLKRHIEKRMLNVRKWKGNEAVEPNGYVINSAICAINAVRDTETFEDALIQAVNLGGDADTVGAITGGLAGALYGAVAIPQRWTGALDKKVVRQIKQLTDKAMKQREK